MAQVSGVSTGRSTLLRFSMITNDPGLAAHAEACGVHRVWVDLEVIGKAERQRTRDTLISAHKIEDVSRLRSVLTKAELLTRVNPLWEGTQQEVDDAVARGTDALMLPMFRTAADVERFVRIVDGRARITGLLETRDAVDNVEAIAAVEGVDDYHVGLTDLHLELGMRFLFQCLAEGHIDRIATAFHARGIPFGFGGIGRIGHGDLPAELIAAEHMRVGSRAVILGRVFHNNARTPEDLERGGIDLAHEIRKVSDAASAALQRTEHEIERDRRRVEEIVGGIVASIEARAGSRPVRI